MNISKIEKMARGGAAIFGAVLFSALFAQSAAAFTFVRGSVDGVLDSDRLWSNLENWASVDYSSTSTPTINDDGWATANPTNVTTGIGTLYFGQYSSYNGTSALSPSDGYAILDVDATVNKIYTSKFYDAGKGESTAQATGITSEKCDGSGERYDTSLIIKCSYGTTTNTVFDAITSTFASSNFTFDTNVTMYSNYKASTSYSIEVANNIKILAGSVYDTVFKQNLSLVANPTNSNKSSLLIKMQKGTLAPTGGLYFSGKVSSVSGTVMLSTNSSLANGYYTEKDLCGKITFNGSVTNAISDLRVQNGAYVNLGMTNGALAATYIRAYVQSTITYVADNQMPNWNFVRYRASNDPEMHNDFYFNLNGHSQDRTAGTVPTMTLWTSTDYTDASYTKYSTVHFDFGGVGTAQEFTLNKLIFDASGGVTMTGADYWVLEISNYILGEDHFYLKTAMKESDLKIFDFVDYDDTYTVVQNEVVLDGNTYYEITVSQVIPEPATFVALLGAVALAFAAYRRRK